MKKWCGISFWEIWKKFKGNLRKFVLQICVRIYFFLALLLITRVFRFCILDISTFTGLIWKKYEWSVLCFSANITKQNILQSLNNYTNITKQNQNVAPYLHWKKRWKQKSNIKSFLTNYIQFVFFINCISRVPNYS